MSIMPKGSDLDLIMIQTDARKIKKILCTIQATGEQHEHINMCLENLVNAATQLVYRLQTLESKYEQATK